MLPSSFLGKIGVPFYDNSQMLIQKSVLDKPFLEFIIEKKLYLDGF